MANDANTLIKSTDKPLFSDRGNKASNIFVPFGTNHGTGMKDNYFNNELRNVHNWLLAHRLSLNVSKTRLMMFYMPQKNVPSLKLSICNLNIEEVDHFNFLGLIIDKNMKWHTHVQKVANKIRNVNGILHKFKYVFHHIILILIYTS